MNRYRISYDKHFLPKSYPNGGIVYKGKIVDGVSLYFRYSYYDLNGNEVFVDKKRIEENQDSPTCFYRCSYNRETGYKMELLETERLPLSGYSRVDYEEDEAIVFLSDIVNGKSDNMSMPFMIAWEEAIQLLKDNADEFDNSDNHYAQELSYSLTLAE